MTYESIRGSTYRALRGHEMGFDEEDYARDRGLWAVLVAMGLLVAGLVWVVLTTAGCALSWHPAGPDSPNEQLLISETSRFAGFMGVAVKGEIATTLNQDQLRDEAKGVTPTAWYSAGVAYYYRPMLAVLRPGTPDGPESCTNVAAHEVCHAVTGPEHDLRHWECMAKWAQPTYPKP